MGFNLFGMLSPQTVAGQAHVSPSDLDGILRPSTPQPAPLQPLPNAVPGLDEALGNVPASPYALDATAAPSILEQYLPQMNDMYARGLGDYNAARQMSNDELKRQKARDFIDEFTGNVLMPLSAKGLGGAAELAMGESKRILNQLHDDRKGRIEHAQSQGDLINNLARIIKQVDPNDVDNLMKERQQQLSEKQFQETQKQNQIGNDLGQAKFAEDVRQGHLQDTQHKEDSAARMKEHADNMAVQSRQLDLQAKQYENAAAQAKANNDLARFNAYLNAAKETRAEKTKADEQARTAAVKAVELARSDALAGSEQVLDQKSGKMVKKHADNFKPMSAADYYRQMGYGDQPQQQNAVAQSANTAPVSQLDVLRQYRDQVRAQLNAMSKKK